MDIESTEVRELLDTLHITDSSYETFILSYFSNNVDFQSLESLLYLCEKYDFHLELLNYLLSKKDSVENLAVLVDDITNLFTIIKDDKFYPSKDKKAVGSLSIIKNILSLILKSGFSFDEKGRLILSEDCINGIENYFKNMDVQNVNLVYKNLKIETIMKNLTLIEDKIHVAILFAAIDGFNVTGNQSYVELVNFYSKKVFEGQLNSFTKLSHEQMHLLNNMIVQFANREITFGDKKIKIKESIFDYTTTQSDLDDLNIIVEYIIKKQIDEVFLGTDNFYRKLLLKNAEVSSDGIFKNISSDLLNQIYSDLSYLPLSDVQRERMILIYTIKNLYSLDIESSRLLYDNVISKLSPSYKKGSITEQMIDFFANYKGDTTKLLQLAMEKYDSVFRTELSSILNIKISNNDFLKTIFEGNFEKLLSDSELVNNIQMKINSNVRDLSRIIDEVLIDYILKHQVELINSTNYSSFIGYLDNYFSLLLKIPSDFVSRNFVDGFNKKRDSIYKALINNNELIDIKLLPLTKVDNKIDSFTKLFNYYLENNITFSIKDKKTGVTFNGNLNNLITLLPVDGSQEYSFMRYSQCLIIHLINESFNGRYVKNLVSVRFLTHLLMAEMIGSDQNCGGHYESPLIFPYSVSVPYQYTNLLKYGSPVTFDYHGITENIMKSFWDKKLSIYDIIDIANNTVNLKNSYQLRIVNGRNVDPNVFYVSNLKNSTYLESDLQSLIVQCIINSNGMLESLFPSLPNIVFNGGV